MNHQRINLFEPLFSVEECLDELRDVLTTGWTAPGDKTLRFESAWSEYTGLPHSHFVSSATAGLHLALHVLTKHDRILPAEREVVTTPLTFVSTNHVILYEGFKPRFADIDESLCMSPASVESRINENTVAVIFVGIGGNVGGLSTVSEICRERKVPLILDAAHMAGTRWVGDSHVGAEADAAVFSFQSVKNLPVGDGGMVCFRDEWRDLAARQLSWMGIDKNTHERSAERGAGYKYRYDVPHVGWKYQGNALAAALGLVGLRHLDRHNAYRRQLAIWYFDLLRDVPKLMPISHAAHCESSRHLFQVRVPHRDHVIMGLNIRDIYPGVHYIDNRTYPMYQPPLVGSDICPVAHNMSQDLLSLPLHCRMTRKDVERVVQALSEILT